MVMRFVFGRIVLFSSVDRYGHFGGTSYLVLMLVVLIELCSTTDLSLSITAFSVLQYV